MEALRASVRKLRDEAAVTNGRIDSLSLAEALEPQVKEATAAAEKRAAARIAGLEQRLDERQAVEAAQQSAWREAMSGRCDAVERRVAQHHREAQGLVDQVAGMVPDIEQVRGLCSGLQADRAKAESWQR